MNNLQVLGKQKFMGVMLPILEGGFGESQKSVLAKDIAIIHGKELGHINENIKILIDKHRIKENIHYIDIKSIIGDADLGIKVSNATKNVFLLSERGYASLVKYMDDDKSWEIHDKLVDEYFQLQEIVEKVSKNYSLRMDNLGRLFTRVYPQQFEEIAKEILDFHMTLGKKQRLDERHKGIEKTEYKQFARDKIIEALDELQKDVNNPDIVSIRLYSKDLIIKLQKDLIKTTNISDGKKLGFRDRQIQGVEI